MALHIEQLELHAGGRYINKLDLLDCKSPTSCVKYMSAMDALNSQSDYAEAPNVEKAIPDKELQDRLATTF